MSKKGKRWNYDESARKFVLPPYTRFDTIMLPVIQNLAAMGLTATDIGVIVGCTPEAAKDWLDNVKKNHPEAREAWAIGAKVADANLVAQMYKTACGYEYTKQKYKADPATGEMTLVEESVEHQPANAQLAMFIATNRMPEHFKHRVELSKQGLVIDSTNEVSADQIERLAGALVKEAERMKVVDATIISAHSEDEHVECERRRLPDGDVAVGESVERPGQGVDTEVAT